MVNELLDEIHLGPGVDSSAYPSWITFLQDLSKPQYGTYWKICQDGIFKLGFRELLSYILSLTQKWPKPKILRL